MIFTMLLLNFNPPDHHFSISVQVTYETLGFLEKNRDTLKLDISQLLKGSENHIVQSLFQTPLSCTGGLSPASTVSKAPPSATPLFSRKAPPMVS